MKPDKHLMERFLRNQCTNAEAEAVDRFFKENPDELEQYLPLSGWLANSQQTLSTTVSERILKQIREKYKKKRTVSVAVKMLRYAAAASVVCVGLWLGLKLFGSTSTPEKKTVAVTYINSTDVLNTIENKTEKVMQVSLPDCSVVTLYPNSVLQHLPAFEPNRRILYLTGKAGFDVRKDKSRPFTVYASGIATTAVGTRFLVSVLDAVQVSVILKEGLVKVAPQHSKDSSQQVVLHPGDQLIVSNQQFSNYSLTRDAVSAPAVKDRQIQSAPEMPKDTIVHNETKLVFKNQPLKEVFSKIEERFGVTIDYKHAPGIDEKLFTGVFLENDSLEFICNLICKLHGLHYSIANNVVVIEAN